MNEQPSNGSVSVTFGPPDDPRKWVSCANTIAARILDGTYPAGEWIPSMGRIGVEFRAGWATVKETFEALSAKGLITSAGKPGYYVGNGRPPEIPRPRPTSHEWPSGDGPAELGEDNSTLLTQRYLTVQEISAKFRVAKMTVYRMIWNGDIERVIRVRNSYRIPESSVQEYLKDRGSVIDRDLTGSF